MTRQKPKQQVTIGFCLNIGSPAPILMNCHHSNLCKKTNNYINTIIQKTILEQCNQKRIVGIDSLDQNVKDKLKKKKS